MCTDFCTGLVRFLEATYILALYRYYQSHDVCTCVCVWEVTKYAIIATCNIGSYILPVLYYFLSKTSRHSPQCVLVVIRYVCVYTHQFTAPPPSPLTYDSDGGGYRTDAGSSNVVEQSAHCAHVHTSITLLSHLKAHCPRRGTVIVSYPKDNTIIIIYIHSGTSS